MASDRETTIRRWMLATVSDGRIERLDDLHVDDIDAGWKDPSNWVSAGLTAYGLALGIRRELGLDVTVALAFSLLDGQDTSETFSTRKRNSRSSLTGRRHHSISSRSATSSTFRPRSVWTQCRGFSSFPSCPKIPSPFSFDGLRKTAVNDVQCLFKRNWRNITIRPTVAIVDGSTVSSWSTGLSLGVQSPFLPLVSTSVPASFSAPHAVKVSLINSQ